MQLAYGLSASTWPSNGNKGTNKQNKQRYGKRKGKHLQKLNMVILNFNFEIQIVLVHHNFIVSGWQKGTRFSMLCK